MFLLSTCVDRYPNVFYFFTADRFWGCWSVMVMLVILYSPDSPAMMLMDYRTWYAVA